MGYRSISQLIEKRYYADTITSIDCGFIASLYTNDELLLERSRVYFSAFDYIFYYGFVEDPTFIRNVKDLSDSKVSFISPFPLTYSGLHTVDFILSHLQKCGIEPHHRVPTLYLKTEDFKYGNLLWENLFGKGLHKRIVFHPGSGNIKKNWPLHNYIFLARQVLFWADDVCIVFLTGPAEETVVDELRAQVGERIQVVSKASLLHIASLLATSHIYVGNDSGITHIAASLSLPTVAIFGSSDERLWSPRGEKVRVITGDTPCRPCSREIYRGCKDLACLLEIDVETIMSAMRELMTHML
ncbi:MAG: glycosyltransferase family 9 protein [Thermodesulfobacteriota bacterium]|nr:glycosyltransferase family 9 protein [Thermodesulfobacteriota bacterium]